MAKGSVHSKLPIWGAFCAARAIHVEGGFLVLLNDFGQLDCAAIGCI